MKVSLRIYSSLFFTQDWSYPMSVQNVPANDVATDSQSASSQSAWGQLVSFIEQKQAESHVPGIVVGILHNGEVSAQGFGVTNVDHPLPVTDTTLFQIGSITKTFTGTLVMRLVEQGKVELDATVRTYLPDFKVVDDEVAAQVTVRQLMTHVAGWEGDLFLDTGACDDALAKYVAAMAEQAQLAPRGQYWSYNNAGFALLGRIIEVVTGEAYATVLKREVLDLLGLCEAFLAPTDVMTRRYAAGHAVKGESAEVLRPWHLSRATEPMGGLITDVHNLLRYARFHLGDGSVANEPVISPESVAAMQVPQVTVFGDEKWGLTWSVDQSDGLTVVQHGGGTTGQITRLMLVPAHNFAIALFTNAYQGGAVGKAIADKAFELYLGVKRAEPKALDSSADELKPYAGRYANAFSDVEFGLLAGRLLAQFVAKKGFPTQDTPPAPPPPPATFGLVSADRLIGLDGGYKDVLVDVVRTPEGSIGWLRISGRLYRRNE
jgi:CubicO group peptidase (beta-lactamase class C family)